FRCGACNGAMHGATRVSKSKKGTAVNWHYRCGLKYRHGAKALNACRSRNVEGPTVEAQAWAALAELLLDEKKLFDKIDEEQERKRAAIRGRQQKVAALEARKQKVNSRL